MLLQEPEMSEVMESKSRNLAYESLRASYPVLLDAIDNVDDASRMPLPLAPPTRVGSEALLDTFPLSSPPQKPFLDFFFLFLLRGVALPLSGAATPLTTLSRFDALTFCSCVLLGVCGGACEVFFFNFDFAWPINCLIGFCFGLMMGGVAVGVAFLSTLLLLATMTGVSFRGLDVMAAADSIQLTALTLPEKKH